MKELRILLAAGILLATACSRPQAPAPEPEPEPQPVFNEANFPKQSVDVANYSGGIQHIGLPTSQVQRTIDFYETLGFQVATRHDISGRDFAFLRLGNMLIEVIPTDDPAMLNGAVDHFCLDVKNIDELFNDLRQAGYHMLSDEIQDIAFWEHGARYFFIQGPNNEKIEFCEILQ